MIAPVPDQGSLEREVKLDVDVDFVVPKLPKVVGASEWQAERQLRTAYFDTPDFRLWRRAITLRHRMGEGPGPGTWTLKLPGPSEGSLLNRTELTWTGPRLAVPDEAARLMLGIMRRASLGQIVELVTTRRPISLYDPSGVPRAELDDDSVTVVGGTRSGLRFRQLELELEQGGEVMVDPIMNALIRAGARPDGEQKLAKAVDLPVRAPGDPSPRIDRRSTVGDIVTRSVATALDRLIDNDYLLRVDPVNPPVEGVHQARVATRRLRSELKLLGSALDDDWVHQVRGSLKWLGAALGLVRDADVLAPLLDGDGDGTPFDRDGRRELRSKLDEQRSVHSRDLASVLADSRYLTLLDQLDEALRSPPLEESPSGSSGRSPLAHRRAKTVLSRLVGKRWKALRKRVRRAGRHPSDRELHGMRIRAKELRYAAETATPVMGKPARGTAAAARSAQKVLGEHHDAVGAELWLRDQAMRGTVAASYSAGRLAAGRARSQSKLRRRWRSVWRRLDRRRLRRWFKAN